MQLLEWNQCYEVGVVDIDVDHRKLFAAYNRFVQAILNHEERKTIQEEFSSIAVLLQNHFSAEEILLRRLCCPNYSEHLATHQHLIIDLQEQQKKLLELDSKPHQSLSQFADHFRTWMVAHIAEDAEDIHDCDTGIAIMTGSAV